MASKIITLTKLILTIVLILWLMVDSDKYLVKAELERIEHDLSTSTKYDQVSFLVVGDWGRKGAYNQSLVASQMGMIGEKLDVDFIISTGDNFYDSGLKGIDDPAFHESFSDIYTSPSLQKQWYSVLGNHDYRGDVLSQLSPVLRQFDSKWLCLRSFIVNAEVVDLFFVDTTPFQDKYFEESDHTYDWRDVLPREKYLSNLLKDIDQALKESTATWKIVIGHHTIMSAGYHGGTKELVTQLLPILESNEVDFYINGHDHCLEHISSSDSQLQFLTSGGGSKAWRGEIRWWNPKEMKFYYDGQGFMSVQVTKSQAKVVFYDIFGNELHKWFSTKPTFHSSI